LTRNLVHFTFDNPINEAREPAGLIWLDTFHSCLGCTSVGDLFLVISNLTAAVTLSRDGHFPKATA
jgi:hypothetical protein